MKILNTAPHFFTLKKIFFPIIKKFSKQKIRESLLLQKIFDIILMDVQMPIMDGLSTTAVIRALELEQCLPHPLGEQLHNDLSTRLRGGHVQILAMTAHAMGEDLKMCLAVGMDGYITKPFEPDQLVMAMQECAMKNLQRSNTNS